LTHDTPLVLTSDERPWEQWDDERGTLSFATLFGADDTPGSTLTTGLAAVPPGGSLAVHRHAAVETYYVVSGRGELSLDGDVIPVAAGSAVLIPGNAWHGVCNVGDEPLRVFYTFAAEAMSDVVYEFAERR
jgi:quercetin dioxygenase-like cupin family protein